MATRRVCRLALCLSVLVGLWQTGAVAQPADMAKLTVTTNTANHEGFLYLAPNSRVSPRQFGGYLTVFDRTGKLVAWHSTGTNFPFDFKILPDGRMAWTEFGVFNLASKEMGVTIIDSLFQTIRTEKQRRGYSTTQHDFHLLGNGNRMVLGAEDITADCSSIVPNGHPAANVVTAILQEQDPFGNVVFQWKSIDHLPISASFEDLTAPAIRYVHNNAAWEDNDGHWLLSLRHLSCIVKVHRETGEVLWVLGGKLNQFTFLDEDPSEYPHYFSYAHDIRRMPNGHISMFDNGSLKPTPYSRGVEYELDEVNKICRRVWQYRPATDVFANIQGGMQTLPNNNRLIAWGSAVQQGSPAVTEVDSTGQVVFEASLPKAMFPYRAEKHRMWPPGRPRRTVRIDDVLQGNTYRYWRGSDTTGITLRFSKLAGAFYNATIVRTYDYAPVEPRFTEERSPDILTWRADVIVEGISNHAMILEIDIRHTGQNIREGLSLYRRSWGDSIFHRVPTRLSGTTLISEETTAGEFCLGFPLSEITARPPLALYPIKGQKVSETMATQFRWSPQGRHRSMHIVVSRHSDLRDPILDTVIDTDKLRLSRPLAAGWWYWHVGASTARTTTADLSFRYSAIDSFEVSTNFIEISTPQQVTEWVRDASATVRWRTNVEGTLAFTLTRNGDRYPILDSVPAHALATLWRVAPSVPPGDNYSLEVRWNTDREIMYLTAPIISIRDGSVSVQDSTSTTLSDHVFVEYFRSSDRLWVGGSHPIDSYEIYSYSGALAHRGTATGSGFTADVSALPQGHYIIALSTSGTVRVRNFAIVR
jgi:hypothetical protein